MCKCHIDRLRELFLPQTQSWGHRKLKRFRPLGPEVEVLAKSFRSSVEQEVRGRSTSMVQPGVPARPWAEARPWRFRVELQAREQPIC